MNSSCPRCGAWVGTGGCPHQWEHDFGKAYKSMPLEPMDVLRDQLWNLEQRVAALEKALQGVDSDE